MEKENNTGRKILSNYLYNAVYQLFLIIIPLITTPYVSRVLSPSGIGQFSFTNSIASYFISFAALGFIVYGQREIAKYQGDKCAQSKIFWELMIAKLLTSVVSLGTFWILIICKVFGDSYLVLMMIASIGVVSTCFDVVFFFQGNERFKSITIRNFIVRTISTVCIFVFVKSESDVWIYLTCNVAALFVSNISLWISLPKMLNKISFKELNIKRHFLPAMKLFIPTLAITLYTMIDKTLIGIMVPGEVTVIDDTGKEVVKKVADLENGYYNQSEQIVKMATTIIAALGTVMIPRNSQQIASGDYTGFRKNIDSAMRFALFLGLPMMFGLMSIATNFTSWFYGPGYEKTTYLIMILSPLSIILGLSNVLGLQYLLPLEKDKRYTISIVTGALVNIVANLALIPFLYSYGACIATIIAELSVTIMMFCFAKKDINPFKSLFINGWRYWIAGLIMFGAVFGTQFLFNSTWYYTIILILEGIFVYFMVLLLLRDQFLLKLLNKGKSKLVRRDEGE